MDGRPERSFLDRPAARLLALLCFMLCIALLGYIHRDDLFPRTAALGTMADDPFARCFADRAGDIDQMRADGVIDDAQATLFRSRAEAYCRAQADDGSQGPSGVPAVPRE